MIGNVRFADAARKEHERKIAENPTTVTITRVVQVRDRGGKTPGPPAAIGPLTMRVYFERAPGARTTETGPGPAEEAQTFGALLPLVLDNGSALADPDAVNDPDVEDTFPHPELGELRVLHVYPIRHGGELTGWQADLEERR